MPHVIRWRGPYNALLFNLPILPEQNGQVKNNWFLKLRLLFALIGPRGEREQRERRAFMMSRSLCVFPSSVSFQ